MNRPYYIEKVAFDVTVGQGRHLTGRTTSPAGLNWAYLTKFKIDVFAKADFGYWMFEIKHTVNAAALGQLIVYDDLIFNGNPGLRPAKKTLLCRQCHPDIYYCASIHGIEVIDVDQFALQSKIEVYSQPSDPAGHLKR